MTSPTEAAGRAAAPFSLSFRASFNKIPDRDRYAAYVLWIIGYSAGAIAAVLGLPRKRVLNCINHSDFRNRSAMSDDERAILLGELKAIRFEDGRPLDEGRLDALDWKIQPLSPSKIRPARRQS